MVIRLDHGSEAEEYEEVLAFHRGNSPLCDWIMWRDADRVLVQPLVGRARHFTSAAEAVESLAKKWQVVVADIIKTSNWPA